MIKRNPYVFSQKKKIKYQKKRHKFLGFAKNGGSLERGGLSPLTINFTMLNSTKNPYMEEGVLQDPSRFLNLQC